jgi:type II secretory pathway component PulK
MSTLVADISNRSPAPGAGEVPLHGRGTPRRRGLILIVVLIMVTLLALLAASFTFMTWSFSEEVKSRQNLFNARVAAESGIQRAIVVLREYRNDPSIWFDNPALFYGMPVSVDPNKDAFTQRDNENRGYDPNAPQVWRCNLVAPNLENSSVVRYGITDECSKLDINRATEEQLRRLFSVAIPQTDTAKVDIDMLVDSLLDWREPAAQPRANGATDEYYGKLDPPYRVKGSRFATIEELMLVKGFTAYILFGEDYNQNGLLDPNEDDGAASFPPDNNDNVLFSGIAPYLTLWSMESNVSRDGRPRINLNEKDTQKLQESIQTEFRPEITSYVMSIRTGGGSFNSVMNLIPAPPKEEAQEEPTQETQDDATTQPAEDGATSQPDGQNPASQPAHSTDQDAARQRSEKKTPTSQPAFANLTAEVPPGTYEDLPLILDRLTVNPVPVMAGRINVSTAGLPVLATLMELTDEDVTAIVEARRQLNAEELATAAWLVTKGAISETKFRRVLPKITTSASAFKIDSVGYGDHVGAVERISVVLEMRGPVAQVRYYRNMSGLGTAYTPHVIERRGGMTERTP